MKKLASLAVTFTFGMAVLSLPTLALAQATLVELGDTGELTGAGVVVPVTVACMDDSRSADVEVQLVQGSAGGEGDLDFEDIPEKCPSTPQTVHVLVRPFGPQFIVGSATADAVLGACDSTGRNCNVPRVSGTINIVD